MSLQTEDFKATILEKFEELVKNMYFLTALVIIYTLLCYTENLDGWEI